MSSFVHLHTHTHYSFQQALWTPEDLVKRAKSLEQTAIAITDSGNLYGAFEFYKACKKQGIKPIIWVEFTISKKWRKNRDKDNELYELVLLAKNYEGYKNLIQLVTFSQVEWFWNGRPRIDFELLERFKDHLLGLSWSMYGEIAQHVITGRSDEFIQERINYYTSLFGKDGFYLELQEHPDRALQPKINEEFVRFSREYGYEIVGTNNSYYMAPEDAEPRDLMACVSDGRPLDDPDRPTLMWGDYSVRPSREMEELFVYAPKAYENTEKIASMIDIVIDYGSYRIPVFPLSQEEDKQYTEYIQHLPSNEYIQLWKEEWLLRKMCIEWLNYRYGFTFNTEEQTKLIHKRNIPRPDKKLSDMGVEELYTLSASYYDDEKRGIISHLSDSDRSIITRLEYELTVVDLMGFNGYFCIVADFIRYGKNNGVPVGPGRWSAAGAILAYLSGITDIDPLRYGLLFERFLNPARVSMPDIDVDFSDEGRSKVLTYVREKYGHDHVAQVCTFGTLAARAAVKDSGKALWIPFAEMNEFAKLIPWKPWITLEQALEESTEFKQAYEDTTKHYHEVVNSALRLEWSVRQLGVHACAVIIAPEPMTNFCPLQPPPKDPNSTVTQFSAGPLEELGLLKMDFLWLRNLTILDRAKRIVEQVHTTQVDLLKIDYEDKNVFQVFSQWDTTWVFQFESAGMRKYLQQLKPNCFEDLIAMVSLYRPGPLAYIPDFIDRKHGRKKVEYPHPSLEIILKPTQGIAVYQEQIMQIVQAFAGFSLGEADILRRAIGKKKYELLMEQRGKFIDAAKVQWHPEQLAIYIFDEIIEPFAWYGFNKSHAACYSMIAYQTAYMKYYYPTEFMTALMVSDEEDTDRIRLEIEEAKSKNIQILPPSVNESRKHFTFIDNSTIRFGLKAIKGLWDGPISAIHEWREERPFTDIIDFIERTGSDVINKKSLESLTLAGALDELGERNSLLKSINKITAYLKEIESKKESSQIGLFDMGDSLEHSEHAFALEKSEPLSFEDRIKWERATIGYPVSGTPLSWVESFVEKRSKNLGMIREFYKKLAEKEEIGVLDEEWNVIVAQETPVIEWTPEWETSSESTETQKTAPKKQDKKYDDSMKARLIGAISEVRKMQTKTGGMMAVATCESVGFIFRIVVFPKSYEEFASKLEEDKIAVVEWRIRLDEVNAEVSIMPNDLKCFSITAFREFAREGQSEKTENSTPETSKPERISSYCIQVPNYWTKDDLLDLKSFLEASESWDIAIRIRIGANEKDTQFRIASLDSLLSWLDTKTTSNN